MWAEKYASHVRDGSEMAVLTDSREAMSRQDGGLAEGFVTGDPLYYSQS